MIANEASVSERTCRDWFQRFKNGVFNVEHKEPHGKFEDADLESLLYENSYQTTKTCRFIGSDSVIFNRLKCLGIIQKMRLWVQYKKPRDV